MDDTAYLHRQLIKLGDMMGDGLHHERDGKWIATEYKRTLKALGLMPKSNVRKNNVMRIDVAMVQRVADVQCGKCGGALTQTKSGSKRAVCSNGHKWQLLK
ncbi:MULTISPECIES: hypothetical protein [Shewanella]|uniref:hypothetical protein n=1 Tax=Shewanella TaxID=22 RepID=UPI00201B2284|nr:hypothetical protein [Shewanella sp. 10B]